MRIKFAAASLAALLVASPAFAQDAGTGAKSGIRVEGRVGVDDVVLSVADESDSKVGVVYGGEAGYDYVMPSGFVLGAYAGIEGASTETCAEVTGVGRDCLKAGRNITAGVRAGGNLGFGVLYAKGGYSNGRIRLTSEDFTTPADNFEDSATLDGFHLGAGYEFGLSSNTYAKLEYVYTKYRRPSDATDVDVKLERHQGVVGFGYRF